MLLLPGPCARGAALHRSRIYRFLALAALLAWRRLDFQGIRRALRVPGRLQQSLAGALGCARIGTFWQCARYWHAYQDAVAFPAGAAYEHIRRRARAWKDAGLFNPPSDPPEQPS